MPRAQFHLAHLRAAVKPFRLYFFPRLRSTNDHAAKLRRRSRLFAPAIVLTPHQIAGRGRGSNTWFSKPNSASLTVTFALPVRERIPPQEIPILAGLAVRDAAAQLTNDPRIQLKWPNDITHNGRKLAGLLCERIDRVDLIGIGLNVNLSPSSAPPNLRNRIASLSSITGKKFDPAEVLSLLAQNLHHAIRRRLEQPFSVFLRDYRTHDALIGKSIIVTNPADPPLTGKSQGIDDKARLLLRHKGAIHRIVAGTVLLAPPK
jgi:BirA family transcriptional regulator, biotin operon repressor / biotin---[acetyl-CoA-carboxylase] ligase